MLRRARVLVLLMLVLGVILSAAGCGSAEQANSSAQKSVLDKVTESGKLTVAVFTDVPPLGYYDEKHELQGIDVDVAREMAKALNVKVEFVSTTNANRIPYLVTNKVDCVIASFTMNPERRKVVEFSDPYFRGGAILVINPENPNSASIKTIEDCKGKNVAVSKGSFNDELATKLVGQTAKSIIRFDNVSDVYKALKEGKADAVVEDVVLAGYTIKTQYPTFKTVGPLLSTDIQGIGVRRGDQVWLNWINGFVFDLLTSGKMKEICNKYGVTYTPVHFVY